MSELMKESHDKYRDRIRTRVWYVRYKHIANLLKEGNCENPVVVLQNIDMMMNNAHGYGYDRIACSALESLTLVVEDMGWVWIHK